MNREKNENVIKIICKKAAKEKLEKIRTKVQTKSMKNAISKYIICSREGGGELI